MPNNFAAIATQTLGSGANTILFDNIPSTYTHLLLKGKVRGAGSSGAQAFARIRFNNISTSTYRVQIAYGRGTSDNIESYPSNAMADAGFFDCTNSGAAGGSEVWSYVEVWIPNYTSTSFRKNAVVKANATQNGGAQGTTLAGFASTALDTTAITAVSFNHTLGFTAGSSATLYGYTVEATNSTKILTQQTFTTSGTFTVPATTTSVQVMCVGGGGGGGGGNASDGICGGGGGGGGVTFHNNFTVTPGSTISYTVGAGGSGGTNGVSPTNGGNTSFSTVVALGGGRGGQAKGNYLNSSTGGSGGGALGNGNLGSVGTEGSGGTDYAVARGGPGNEIGGRGGGGGGGSSPMDGGGTSYSGTNQGGGGGGNGNNTFLNANYFGAGGGGGGNTAGGQGGYLGGGNGGTSSAAATAGTPGTGGGGGGGGRNDGTTGNGTAGGSGLIILRYGV